MPYQARLSQAAGRHQNHGHVGAAALVLGILILVWFWLLLPSVALARLASGDGRQLGEPNLQTTPLQQDCSPRVIGIHSIPATHGMGQRPARGDPGWLPVPHTPDFWQDRWPDHEGAVWYRVDWQQDCAGPQPALGLARISMAGAVFSNEDLLWRDDSLEQPLSQSWNVPRYWPLPASSLHAQGDNAVWIYVVGLSHLSPGIGRLSLGPVDDIAEWHAKADFLQRELFKINLIASTVVGFIFFSIWLYHPSRSPYGWFALMALSWTLFGSYFLATSPWPFPTTQDAFRWNHLFFLVYVAAFCSFTWSFGEQRLERLQKLMWGSVAVLSLALLLAPRAHIYPVIHVGSVVMIPAYLLNCLQFQWHAWRTRRREHVILAVCLLVYLGLVVHDFLSVLRVTQAIYPLTPLSSMVNLLVMSLLLAWSVAEYFRRMQRFNQELQVHVAQTRQELTETLQQQHALAMRNARLEERLALARELHDGLGGALVRSIASVEHAREAVKETQMLSMLKGLRDDLRQIIDNNAESDLVVPAEPAQWCAPLRHRFVGLFDTLGIASTWELACAWPMPVQKLQLLSLARVLEEALTNVLKHSQAHQVRVQLTASDANGLQLRIEDDGIGFEAASMLDGAHGIGLRSMRARIERLGGKLRLQSQPGQGTCVTVLLPAPESQA